MGMEFNDAGCTQVLKAYFNNVWPAGGKDLTLKLFCNNVNPLLRANVVGDFTEANGGDYSAKTLLNGSWTVEANTPRDALYTQQTFIFNGPLSINLTIYGYYIIDKDSNVITAELLGAPFQPYNNGDELLVTPKIQMSSGTPA